MKLWLIGLASMAALGVARGWRRPGQGTNGSKPQGASSASPDVHDDTFESLNQGESLESSHLRGAFAGVGSHKPTDPRVFRDPSQTGNDGIQPGLPDFARGA
jgi:hypothetical protein